MRSIRIFSVIVFPFVVSLFVLVAPGAIQSALLLDQPPLAFTTQGFFSDAHCNGTSGCAGVTSKQPRTASTFQQSRRLPKSSPGVAISALTPQPPPTTSR